MIFNNHTLSTPLKRHVEAIFHFENFVPDHSIERVIPTGHVFMLFELDGMLRHTFDNESLAPNAEFRQAWISGVNRHYISISAHENSEMFVIQFKPGGAHPYIDVPVSDWTDRVIPAEEVLGGELLQLREQIASAETSEDKFDAAEQWLMRRFDDSRTPPESLLEFVDQLQTEPASKYTAITDGYPNSQKHLIDQFKQYIGLTPKQFQRIARFNDILGRIQQQDNISWSEVAYQCGFSDQSHFIKEFKTFSGFNPQEFIDLDHQHAEPNFFPLDRN